MDPLEAALSSSFSAPDVPPATSQSNPSSQQPETSGEQKGHAARRSIVLEEERLAAADESWKKEYDERLSHWKAENAARREQSEKTRGEWEQRRSSKEYDAGSYVTPSVATSSMASSFVDARDLVSGEGEGGHGREALDRVLPPSAKAPRQKFSTASGSGEDNSQGWENVHSESLTSSYPSISFPPLDEKTGRATGVRQHDSSRHRGDGDDRRQPTAGFTLPPVAPPSVTLSVFDSTLSTRARTLALVSSLAINLVLPFINGVMLGFGEIAAKSLFAWGGWRDLAGGLGLRSAGSRAKTK
ncbi:hypothetical protein FRC17_007052 [Serendipita sp. 399]|nr:hypothetical protein FRC17_007052 [Serendipita sp. 399]